MKLLAVFLVLACCASALASADSHWTLFKRKHAKSYPNPAEDATRRQIFLRAKQRVDQFNAARAATYTKGLSHLSDWTQAELASLRGVRAASGGQVGANSRESQAFLDGLLREAASSVVPDELDWRQVPGRVTDVKDQGQCGSCWAFATIGILEGQELSKSRVSPARAGRKSLDPLSEQQVMDCSPSNAGCDGGLISNALLDLSHLPGMEDEDAYPYYGLGGMDCELNSTEIVMNANKGFANLPSGDEEKLKQIVASYGPVGVLIDATKEFHDYHDGILDDQTCGSSITDINHAVLVVGYGTDKKSGGDYWIVKNSWSADWGSDGYVLMSRNKDNQCGIALMPTIATF